MGGGRLRTFDGLLTKTRTAGGSRGNGSQLRERINRGPYQQAAEEARVARPHTSGGSDRGGVHQKWSETSSPENGGSVFRTLVTAIRSTQRSGTGYQFVLLSSAQRVRREEERAAWQRLVRVLGHEVNNTLAPIQSLAATCRAMLAEDAAGAAPQVLSALEVMEHRAASLGRFISEFARLARLPEPRLEPLELGAHVRRVVALDGRCPVHVVGKQQVELLADGPLLEQALLNLIRNAIDASLARQGAVTIDWHADADSAVLSIIDEGTGVTNSDNLFVPLFSTKPQGSGIGLVLARNIVEAHGGQLRLDNRQRTSGCVARVTLPRAPRSAAARPLCTS
jgi:two-component system nitrogen regulation sensor histidine kinase NtrY